MKKRTILLIVISLVLAFGLVGPAAADAPETVTCWLPWFYSDGTFTLFESEGQLVHTGQGFNLTCPYTFDFSDPAIASIEQICQEFIDCNRYGPYFHLSGWGADFEYNGEWMYLNDVFMHVNSTGKVTMHAQYAPDQCSSENRIYSYTLEFPAGYWSPGAHSYTIYWLDADGYENIFSNVFTVDASAPLADGQVRLGIFGASPIDVINPAQDTFMQLSVGWPAKWYSYINLYHDNDYVTFSWDGSEPLEIQAGNITNACTTFDNPAYLRRNHGYAK